MKRVKKTIRALALMVLVCMLLSTTVFAAPNGSAWLNALESAAEDTTTAVIAADTAVSDGLIEITYDSTVLTYEGIKVDEKYVAMYAVNADEAGLVKISWVAPKDFKVKKNPVCLMEVSFSGTGAAVSASGTLFNAQGSQVELSVLDTAALKGAVETAKSLNKDAYTNKSYKAVEKALKDAEKVLADPAASQSRIDEAAKKLNDALNALESKGKVNTQELVEAINKASSLDASKYTKKSYAAVEKALEDAKEVLANPNATQKQVDKAVKSLNAAMDKLEEVKDQGGKPGKPEKPEKPGNPGKPGKNNKTLNSDGSDEGFFAKVSQAISGLFSWLGNG